MAFGGGLDNHDDEVMSEINMTPLVDVMLVLLIIFIIAMPLLKQATEIDLPIANTQPLEQTSDTIVLSIKENGDLFWRDQVINEETLHQRLQNVAQQQPQAVIHLQGDRFVDYQHVMKVMAAAQQAGVTQLGFVTDPE